MSVVKKYSRLFKVIVYSEFLKFISRNLLSWETTLSGNTLANGSQCFTTILQGMLYFGSVLVEVEFPSQDCSS